MVKLTDMIDTFGYMVETGLTAYPCQYIALFFILEEGIDMICFLHENFQSWNIFSNLV